ncbi:MAG: outer membrane protein assembly factor BamB family protein, partial [Verrucomicrobiales bacterium]
MQSRNRLIILVSLFATTALGESPKIDEKMDWPWWRGPSHLNKAAIGAQPVTEFSDSKHVLWKAPVSGRGHASPTVMGNRIFLATSNQDKGSQSVVAFDRDSGKQLWIHDVNTGGLPGKIHAKNTHASSTIACDGERLFCVFYNNNSLQVTALGVSDGEPLWDERLGPYAPKRYEFGFAASPLIHGDHVIVLGDSEEGGFLTALGREKGNRVWTTDRPKEMNFSSPIVAKLADSEQLIISGCSRIAAYDPITGKALWESKEAFTDVTCGTVVWEGDLIFASGGFPKPLTIAVRAGTGETVWQNKKKSYEQSMLIHKGYLYTINDTGIAYCWRASDGEEMWSERLKGPI